MTRDGGADGLADSGELAELGWLFGFVGAERG